LVFYFYLFIYFLVGCRHNPKAGEMAPIVLDGGPPSDMKLLSVTLDRVPLQAGSDYKVLTS
jgi:hypothetical protein